MSVFHRHHKWGWAITPLPDGKHERWTATCKKCGKTSAYTTCTNEWLERMKQLAEHG